MIKNKMILDNLVVVFSMFLWALGLPILDLQQEGWDGFSLSSARALLAGLTMLGLAYFSRPVLFRRKEVLTSFFLGIFGYGLASLLLVIGIERLLQLSLQHWYRSSQHCQTLLRLEG